MQGCPCSMRYVAADPDTGNRPCDPLLTMTEHGQDIRTAYASRCALGTSMWGRDGHSSHLLHDQRLAERRGHVGVGRQPLLREGGVGLHAHEPGSGLPKITNAILLRRCFAV